MTICIAATNRAGSLGGTIVLVSDRLLSALDDSMPAAETLKARKIARTWTLMFAGNGDLFLPIHAAIGSELRSLAGDQPKNDTPDLETVQKAVANAYRKLFDAEFTGLYLSRYGFSSISEFRRTGQSLGEQYPKICGLIDDFDLSLSLIVCGFDAQQAAHIFEVHNPGHVINQDLLGYAAIGTGTTMALASLRRKPIPSDRDSLIYRALSAKFSAETAAGVGRNSVLFTMSPSGKDNSINLSYLRKIKNVYKNELKKAEPPEALSIISSVLGIAND